MGCGTPGLPKNKRLSGFNPRTRMGCGVCGAFLIFPPLSFNPRTRMGCGPQEGNLIIQQLFQSTHPHGVRLQLAAHRVSRYGFNPRTRMGCGLAVSWPVLLSGVSIHAPAWGAAFSREVDLLLISFNPRTRMGCGYRRWPVGSTTTVSIHAPAWGAAKLSTS